VLRSFSSKTLRGRCIRSQDNVENIENFLGGHILIQTPKGVGAQTPPPPKKKLLVARRKAPLPAPLSAFGVAFCFFGLKLRFLGPCVFFEAVSVSPNLLSLDKALILRHTF